MMRQVIHLGGNGHCAARLAPAREVMARLVGEGKLPPMDLLDVPYPGFEGRPGAASLDDFLSVISGFLSPLFKQEQTLVYGSGIGGLLALCLRARGEGMGIPLLMQGPVLWGLEHRLMPRLLRPFRILLRPAVALRPFQFWFERRQFQRPLSRVMRQAFFAGYARCTAAPDLFTWLNPALLRSLESRLHSSPGALQGISVWWGKRDRVVSERELVWTEGALGVEWPLRTFARWGHYPMLDDPEGWVQALSEVVYE